MTRNRFPWNDHDIATLLREKLNGMRHKLIARELNRSPGSINQMAHRLRAEGRL